MPFCFFEPPRAKRCNLARNRRDWGLRLPVVFSPSLILLPSTPTVSVSLLSPATRPAGEAVSSLPARLQRLTTHQPYRGAQPRERLACFPSLARHQPPPCATQEPALSQNPAADAPQHMLPRGPLRHGNTPAPVTACRVGLPWSLANPASTGNVIAKPHRPGRLQLQLGPSLCQPAKRRPLASIPPASTLCRSLRRKRGTSG